MKYKIQLEATVEAESAEAAEQMVFDIAANSTGEVEVTATPTKEWSVSIELTPVLAFSVTVNAESAEAAESRAYELVEEEAYHGSGIVGVLDLADYSDYEIGDFDINAYDATPVDEDEEDAEPAQSDTTTAVDDGTDSAESGTATAA